MPKLLDYYSIPSDVESAWKPLISTRGAIRVLNRQRMNKGVQLYPEIYSDQGATPGTLRKLAIKLSETFKVTENENGTVGPNAIAGDFYQLLTVAGHGMNPITVPPMKNAGIRRELELTDGWASPRHREIFRRLVRLMCATKLPSKVSIRREASTGCPDYVNEVPKKKKELLHALKNLGSFLDLVDKGALLELFVEYNAPIVQTTGERTQADKVTRDGNRFKSKDREVNDEHAARTGDFTSRKAADKTVMVDGHILRDHFAGRRRTVFGMSFVPNYVVAAIFSTMRAHYLEAYAFTWKHRTPESILEKMRQFKFLAGFDVKQFDQTVPTFMVDEFCSELKNYVDPRIAKLIRLMFAAPYIVPYPFIAGRSEEKFNPIFGANPFDEASFTMELGLPSGISCNPDFGKLVMMTQYLCLADDFYHDVLEVGIETILRGEHEKYAFLNMGDDCVVLMNEEPFRNHVLNGEYNAQYMAVEPEKPISFLGNVPYTDERGELQLAPNIASFFVNWLVPEFGVENHRRRNFWAVGDRERRQHYAKSPAYSEAYGIYEEIFVDGFGRSPSSITADYYDQQKKMGSLSFIDALVLQNPSYLQYRFEENQVSPEILDQLVTSLPAEEVWPLIQSFL